MPNELATKRGRVRHRQIYKPGPFGGVINTTLCGRVRNEQDYNVAEQGEEVTCSYCRRLIAQHGEPDTGEDLL